MEKKKTVISLFVAILILALVVASLFLLPKNVKKATPNIKDKSLISGVTWIHYDKDLNENLVITFGKKGEYSYHCECGEPEGDSDIYETYSYDPKTQIISLKGKDKESSKIKMLFCDGIYLCLLFEKDGVTVFKNEDNMPYDKLEPIAEGKVETENSALVYILKYENDELTVAPYNYDGDARKDFEDRIYKINAAKDVKFSYVSVKNDRGEESIEIKDLTNEDEQNIGQYYTGAYVGFNANGEISRVTFYGVLTIH